MNIGENKSYSTQDRYPPFVINRNHCEVTSIDHSPEMTRKLYGTGMRFKNSNSPIACDVKLSLNLMNQANGQ